MPGVVATESHLHRIGWREPACPNPPQPGAVLARVVVQHRNAYEVHDGRALLRARTRSSARRNVADATSRPAVGDWVWLSPGDGSDWQIESQLPRHNVLRRTAAGETAREQVIAANIDTVFIVCGLDGDFNPRRIERYLAIVGDSGACPVIVLTKADCSRRAESQVLELKNQIGPHIATCALNAKDPSAVAALSPWLLAGHTLVLVGSSGAGKSTLTNTLLGSERMRTGAVREQDSRGRHTTTHRALIQLPGGACIIDTPGMREVKLTGDEAVEEQHFADIEALQTECRFRDCAHNQEPGCAVRAAIDTGRLAAERYAHYLKLRDERDAARLRNNEHAKRAVDRKGNKAFGERLTEKYGRR